MRKLFCLLHSIMALGLGIIPPPPLMPTPGSDNDISLGVSLWADSVKCWILCHAALFMLKYDYIFLILFEEVTCSRLEAGSGHVFSIGQQSLLF